MRLLRSLVIRLGGEMGSTRNIVSPERVVSMLIVQKHLSARRGRRAMQEGREAVQRELWNVLFDPESRDGLATRARQRAAQRGGRRANACRSTPSGSCATSPRSCMRGSSRRATRRTTRCGS